MAEIFPLLRLGRLAPPPWQVSPLAAASNAQRLLESGSCKEEFCSFRRPLLDWLNHA